MEKTNVSLNLIKHQLNIDKTCLYTKNQNEPEHQLLINKYEQKDIKLLKDQKNLKDAYPNIVNCVP